MHIIVSYSFHVLIKRVFLVYFMFRAFLYVRFWFVSYMAAEAKLQLTFAALC